MANANADAALIIGEDDRVDGIFTDRDLAFRVIGAGLDPRRTRVSSVMTESPQCVMDDEPALAAISLMIEGGFRHVPVVDSTESVVGLLDVAKCLHDAISSVELGDLSGAQRTVRELLASRQPATRGGRPITVEPTASVQAAAKLMATHPDVPALLVAGGGARGRACTGILTPKDLLNRVIAVGGSVTRSTVESVMTPNPAHVDEAAPLLTALHLLQGSGFRHLPVVSSDGSRPLGVLDVLSLLEGCLVSGDGVVALPMLQQRNNCAPPSTAGDNTPHAVSPPFGTPLAPGFFLFKVSVATGAGTERVLRLRSAENSLNALTASVGAKLHAKRREVILTGRIDDASALLPLGTDAELSAAVTAARAAGRDRLLVFASLGDDADSFLPSPRAATAIVRKLFEKEAASTDKRQLAAGAALAAAALVGVGLALRRGH